MSGILMPHPILAHTTHPCLPQRRYSKVYLVICKWSALNMKLDMAGILFSCYLVVALGSYLKSKYSIASSISDTSATFGYGTTWTGRPSSSNSSNQPSISFFGLGNIAAKASREVFIAFSLMMRSWTYWPGPSWKSFFKHLTLSGTTSSVSISTPLSPPPPASCYFSSWSLVSL